MTIRRSEYIGQNEELEMWEAPDGTGRFALVNSETTLYVAGKAGKTVTINFTMKGA